MALAPGYKWLETLSPQPRMLQEALKELGTVETPGKASNPKIIGWADEVTRSAIGYTYQSDDVPWCGLFIAVVAKRADKEIPFGPLYALNWQKFGTKSPVPSLGDVLVFKREGGGHVGLYVAEDDTAYHVLGGNQSDKVCITRIAKNRLYACRRPPFKNAMPDTVKPYRVKASGGLSINEK